MMNKIFNLTSVFKSHEEEDGCVHICGMASTGDFDRAGDTILPEAWSKGGLSNFEKNPIILFNHDYNRPIGRATGLKIGENGLELKAKISKAEPQLSQLIKDGVLGAFSVGFRVKDADYIEETDGYKIKDAELFEVSVVSVPCNQAATFSLSKGFDSMEEYKDFMKTFTNREALAGQSLAGEESLTASDRLVSASYSDATKEIEMSGEVKTPEIDLEALAKKVAEETAAKIAMKQAETKAAEEAARVEAEAQAAKAAEEKAAKDAEVKAAIETGVQTGTEKLIEEVQSKLTAKNAEMDEVLKKYEADLKEKSDEIEKMRDSKKVFADRASSRDSVSKFGQELMYAHMLGVMTKKGWDTNYGRDLFEKAGISYTAQAADIDQEVSSQIEKEIMRELRVATLFREINVNGAATVLPIQPDTGKADWAINATTGNLENRDASSAGYNQYEPKQVILNAYRLVSSTFMDNDVDEQVLVNLMPMLVEGVARAHAREVEDTILNGNGTIQGLDNVAAGYDPGTFSIASATKLTAAMLLGARASMGKYGINPTDLAYIVSQNSYYDLLQDAEFQNLNEVGSDLAAKVTGTMGAVFGTPVVVSDEFPAETTGAPAAFCVYRRNYVIPRLRGVTVEQDYEVMNQRRVIVASQSLGFEELLAGDGTNEPSVKIDFEA